MKKLAFTVALLAFWAIRPVHAAEFFCPSGNVTCLIAAMTSANFTRGEDTIFLESGNYILSTVNNNDAGESHEPRFTAPSNKAALRLNEARLSSSSGPRRKAGKSHSQASTPTVFPYSISG